MTHTQQDSACVSAYNAAASHVRTKDNKFAHKRGRRSAPRHKARCPGGILPPAEIYKYCSHPLSAMRLGAIEARRGLQEFNCRGKLRLFSRKTRVLSAPAHVRRESRPSLPQVLRFRVISTRSRHKAGFFMYSVLKWLAIWSSRLGWLDLDDLPKTFSLSKWKTLSRD